jgi:hypothetical protein
MEIKITKADETKQATGEIIDYNNEEGWLTYKDHSDEIANEIKKIALNRELNIDEVREKIRATDEMIQRKCFGTKWVGPKKQKRAKKRPLNETKELFQEQCEELDDLIAAGTQYKDVNRRLWRLKELICGPKVGSTEPACINNPMSGELITDKETIKKVSLEHCARILTKNEIRACDKEELMTKEKMHEEVMMIADKDSYDEHVQYCTGESEEEGQKHVQTSEQIR